jgi:SNF2 family DNA or RNA helicase
LIYIQLQQAQKVKAQESLFVSFPYNLALVEKIKSLPTRFYVGDSKSWEVPIESINAVLEMFNDEEIKIVAPRAVTEVKKKTAPKAAKSKEVKFDQISIDGFEFKTTPFDHQVEALNYSVDNAKFLLGDEQGLGKTKQAIDIAVSKKGQFKHVLILCGVNGVKRNWLDEVKMHSNEGARIMGSYYNKSGKLVEGSMEDRLDDLRTLDDVEEYFIIVNKESLRDVPKKEKRGKKMVDRVWPDDFSKMEQTYELILQELEKLIADGTIGMIIVDEVHKLKNATKQEPRALLRLRPHYRMALTGTPLMNKPTDLYVILNWLEMDRNSYYMFEKRYVVKGGYGGHETIGYNHTEELHDKLQKVMLRRKKSEVLDLPPKIRQTQIVEMSKKQRSLYAEVRGQIEQNLAEIALSSNPLAQLLRLRQVTSHPLLVSSQFTDIEDNAKMSRMYDLVDELASNGQKAIVFSNWSEVTSFARDLLAEFNPAYITGENSDPNYRQAEKDRFQNDPDCKVIIGTIGAMGTGLTLTAASTVIFLDKPWNPANTEQAEDRAHRIGTTGTVNIITLVCENSIDDRIEQILAEKGDIFEALVEGKMHKMAQYEMLERLIA